MVVNHYIQGGRRPAVLLLVAIYLVVLGTSIAAASTASPPKQVADSDPYIGCSSDPPARYAPSTASEPRVGIDPTTVGTAHVRLVSVWQQDAASTLGTRGIAFATSADGGQTWSAGMLPFTKCAPDGLGYASVGDPWVSIGPDGTIYATAMANKVVGTDTIPGFIVVAVSHNGGLSWSNAQTIPAPVTGADKDSVTADPTRAGVAYAVWHALGPGSPAYFSKTVDDGKTWSEATPMIPGTTAMVPGTPPGITETLGHELLVDPRSHKLYVVFLFQRPLPSKKVCKVVKDRTHPKGHKKCHTVPPPTPFATSVAFISSTDDGATWSVPHLISPVRLALKSPVRIRGQMPDAAIDPATGRIYVVWEDDRFAKGAYNQIVMSTSSDGGKRWSQPSLVSQVRKEAAVPGVAVNASGVVGVTYYSTLRSAPAKGESVPASYWLRPSSDRGRHFASPVRLAGPFDLSSVGRQDRPGIAPYYFLGDYEGLAAGTAFYPLFALPNPSGSAEPTSIYATSVQPQNEGSQLRRNPHRISQTLSASAPLE